MRTLVSIQTLSEITPHPDADTLDIARVMGWNCVVKKGSFKTNDQALWFEVDSFLPIDPRYEFLRKGCYRKDALGKEGFRLRTMKLRGVISQGLLMPLGDFPELKDHLTVDKNWACELGVTKWDPPIPAELAGDVYGPIPSVIKYTDQERIQNLPDYFVDYKDEEFEATVKIDGSSTTFYFMDDHFGVCGHNWEYREGVSSQWMVARRDKVEEALRRYGKNIALQGEIYGEGVQGNNEKIHGQKVAIFDIWNIDESRYLTPEERTEVMQELWDFGMALDHVPFLGFFKPFSEHPTMDELLAFADGPSKNKDARREGIVYKSKRLINGQTVSFKTISNAYLLKQKD